MPSDDSVELGMPHEPLSITFFKTAFSQANLVGLSLPHTVPDGRSHRRGLSPNLLEKLDEETSQALELSDSALRSCPCMCLLVQ